MNRIHSIKIQKLTKKSIQKKKISIILLIQRENDDSNLKEKNSKEKHSDTNDKKNLSNEIKITNFWLKSFERIP
ncbi:MAG: hypothetical protein KatS3mg002_0773 [Candidatus Woesearchaeota archaeon]|nr:MAG: hypothetical protein KatS3mg002_0773 [Candidatus Woesearchaeota archaeon]